MLTGVLVIGFISLLTSTRAGRVAAREALKPWKRRAALATGILWALIIAGGWPRH